MKTSRPGTCRARCWADARAARWGSLLFAMVCMGACVLLGCHSPNAKTLSVPETDSVVESGDQNSEPDAPEPELDYRDIEELLGVTGRDAPNNLLLLWSGRGVVIERSELLQADEKLIQSIEMAESLDCSPYAMSDELISALGRASRLRWLKVTHPILNHADPVVSADHLGRIAELDLRGLSLNCADLRHADLRVLRTLKQLQWLDLLGTKLPPAEKGLPRLPNLEVLLLQGKLVSDEYLPDAGQFPKLKVLSLGSSSVTDEGLKNLLRAYPQLRYLHLAGSRGITKRSVPVIGEFSKLEWIHLGDTELYREYLREYPTVDDPIEQLRELLPKCWIDTSR